MIILIMLLTVCVPVLPHSPCVEPVDFIAVIIIPYFMHEGFIQALVLFQIFCLICLDFPPMSKARKESDRCDRDRKRQLR